MEAAEAKAALMKKAAEEAETRRVAEAKAAETRQAEAKAAQMKRAAEEAEARRIAEAKAAETRQAEAKAAQMKRAAEEAEIRRVAEAKAAEMREAEARAAEMTRAAEEAEARRIAEAKAAEMRAAEARAAEMKNAAEAEAMRLAEANAAESKATAEEADAKLAAASAAAISAADRKAVEKKSAPEVMQLAKADFPPFRAGVNPELETGGIVEPTVVKEPGSDDAPSAAVERSPVVPPRSPGTPFPETAQVAPPIPANLRAADEALRAADVDETLAAEVAAILNAQPPPRREGTVIARRAAVVRMPSEAWLLQACEGLNQLPETDRPIAFQSILRRYKKLRLEEQGQGR